MANEKKKKKKDTVSNLSGMMVASIVLAVIFYGFVAVATIRGGSNDPSDGKSSEVTTSEAASSTGSSSGQSGSEEADEPTTEEVTTTEEPTTEEVTIPATVAPNEVTVETKGASEERAIQGLAMARLTELENNTDNTIRTYESAFPLLLDTDSRSASANEILKMFQEAQTAVTVYCAAPEEKKVSFIFNAGGEPGCTADVLEILKTYGIHSTFFISHYYEVHSSDLVKQMLAEGHELGNYSYSSPEKGIIEGRTLSDIMTDALNQQSYVRTVFQVELQKYCFPSYSYSVSAGKMLTEVGYQVCFPSVCIPDADADRAFDKASLLSDLTAALHPGAVYAFNLQNGAAAMVLPELIGYVTQQGYTITQLD
ncbi:MAG: polysaccharide deacetylase family protein [Lachnospiraceae bacterium]|nr:polysaccharide deacetylase family protein [Lachnospiraceae bacterium]